MQKVIAAKLDLLMVNAIKVMLVMATRQEKKNLTGVVIEISAVLVVTIKLKLASVIPIKLQMRISIKHELVSLTMIKCKLVSFFAIIAEGRRKNGKASAMRVSKSS